MKWSVGRSRPLLRNCSAAGGGMNTLLSCVLQEACVKVWSLLARTFAAEVVRFNHTPRRDDSPPPPHTHTHATTTRPPVDTQSALRLLFNVPSLLAATCPMLPTAAACVLTIPAPRPRSSQQLTWNATPPCALSCVDHPPQNPKGLTIASSGPKTRLTTKASAAKSRRVSYLPHVRACS